MKYYLNERANMPIKAMGLEIKFDITHMVANSNWGVIAAEDNSKEAKALDSMKGTQGVTGISIADYQAYLKKKRNSSYSRPPEPRIHQPSPRSPRKPAVEAVASGPDSSEVEQPTDVKGRSEEELEATADSEVSDRPPFVTNQKDLANELGVAFGELRKYLPHNSFPVKTDDGYNVSECREYVEAQRKK